MRLRVFFLVVEKMVLGKKFFLGIETGRYQQNLGKQVSKQVSADTNVQSIGIELKILVSPNTTTKLIWLELTHSPIPFSCTRDSLEVITSNASTMSYGSRLRL